MGKIIDQLKAIASNKSVTWDDVCPHCNFTGNYIEKNINYAYTHNIPMKNCCAICFKEIKNKSTAVPVALNKNGEYTFDFNPDDKNVEHLLVGKKCAGYIINAFEKKYEKSV